MKATHDRSLTVELLLQNCMTSLSFGYLLDMIAAILLSSYTCYCIAIGSARKVILLELYIILTPSILLQEQDQTRFPYRLAVPGCFCFDI